MLLFIFISLYYTSLIDAFRDDAYNNCQLLLFRVQFGVAVGIMSKVKECNPADPATLEPTIYTRLTAYYAWLRTNAGQQPAFTSTTAAAPPGRR